MHARLTGLTVRRFKSYAKEAKLELRPLTVIIGRNNSGKSSLIQALLLLQQTLSHRRSEVPLHLEGTVDAFSLRELTTGWPGDAIFEGPELSISWTSTANIDNALGEDRARWPKLQDLKERSGITWLRKDMGPTFTLDTTLLLKFHEGKHGVSLKLVQLTSTLRDGSKDGIANPSFAYRTLMAEWNGNEIDTDKVQIEFDHFLPFLQIDPKGLGPRDRHRAYHDGFAILYEQPLDDLRELLRSFAYLSSDRPEPSSLYRPASVPPADIGVSGQDAARVLHARQGDVVHYLPPVAVTDSGIETTNRVRALPLLEATNSVLGDLGVMGHLRLEDVQEIGFRVLFGKANLPHVGRGLSYLVPTIVLGLLAPSPEPNTVKDMDLKEYLDALPRVLHGAIEEAEIHLHPKVQTRLAHWLVALAQSGRQLIVETHSDHLVRRLRGLIARAGADSDLEKWLAQNVVIASVEQDGNGHSKVVCAKLTKEGSIEQWPEGFMDEAPNEERSIYAARIEKRSATAGPTTYGTKTEFVDREE